MMDNGNTLDDLSADSLPVPVCRFAFDGGAVVRGTNRPFDDRLGAVERDEPLATVFEELETPGDWGHVRAALRNGEQFTVTATAGEGAPARFLVDVTPPGGSADGYLLFTDITNVPEEGDRRCREAAGHGSGPTVEQGLAVDHVASVVSHDLRNPLDVARARLEAAREFDEDVHFDHVERAHERMERIIQDVLTLARGEDVVDPDETVDLGTVAREAWATVETNRATLTVESPLPAARADADRVSRLFENLFRNAVEHGSTGPDSQTRRDVRKSDALASQPESQSDSGDAVEHGSTSPPSQAQEDGATSETSQADGEAVDAVEHGGQSGSVAVTVGSLSGDSGFYVADDGPGIPPDERDRVFEPGYSSDEHGTGLGLAIVARIADLHDWDVAVTGSAAGGARFEISGVDQQ